MSRSTMTGTTAKAQGKINVKHVLVSKLLFMTNSFDESEDYHLPINLLNLIGDGALTFEKSLIEYQNLLQCFLVCINLLR